MDTNLLPPGGTLEAKKLNEAVFELHNPTDSKLDIVFFHGLQFTDYSKAYLETWVTEKGDECWPQTWLPQQFPHARILSVSYDSSAVRGSKRGNMDMESTGQNLVEFVVRQAGVGQHSPVILVGHSLGGLVIKQVCLQAEKIASSNPSEEVECGNFLSNVCGMFFYATPHHGSGLASVAASLPVYPSPLLKYLTLLNKETESLDDGFCELRRRYKWKASGVGEAREVFLPGLSRGLLVVPEESARCDMDYFAQLAEDHVTICKPGEKSCSSYQHLIAFILSIAGKVHLSPGVPIHAAGLHSQAEIVKEMIQKTRLVGIVGMPGMGKTTIARAVFNTISHEYEFTCFINSIKAWSRPAKLEARILASLYQNGRKVKDCEGDWSILEGKKMLLVLDDVNCKDQLRLVLNAGWSKGNSRIIVTSSKKEDLKALGFTLYPARTLNYEASKKLFCHHAFKQPRLPKPLKRLKAGVKQVVERCDGVPLVLEVLGSYLHRPKVEEYQEGDWKETIDRLKEAVPDETDEQRISRKVKLSVESLEPHEKQMFVDLATTFFGWPLHKIHSAWKTSWSSWETAWPKLLSRCLVKKANMSKVAGEVVYMHEVLRDLGKSIALENDGRLWDYRQYEQMKELLESEEENALLEGLMLTRWNKGWGPSLDLDFLARLPHLKFLILKNIPVTGSCDNLPSDLSLLQWRVSASSTIKMSSVSHLGKLAVLDVDTRPALLRPDRIKLDALVGKIADLSELRVLKLEGDFQELPDDFGDLRHLQDLTLSSGARMTSLPDSFGSLSSLQKLHITNTGLVNLPKSFGLLHQLTSLTLECFRLTQLTDSFGQLSSLEILKLSCCEELEILPESLQSLSRLQHLQIHVCPKLQTLSRSFGNLAALKKLEISYCMSLKWPPIFGPLPSMLKLEIMGMNCLPADLSQVSSLRKLSLSEVDAQHLPSCMEKLISLSIIEIKRCRFMAEWHLEIQNLCWIGYRQVMRLDRDSSLQEVCVYLRKNYSSVGPEKLEQIANAIISRRYPHPSRWMWPEAVPIGKCMNRIIPVQLNK